MKKLLLFVVFLLLLDIFMSCRVINAAYSSGQSQEWLSRLMTVLRLENQSVVQYERHFRKFNVHTPYNKVIPDEHHHVEKISRILKSHNREPAKTYPPVREGETLAQAYKLDRGLEKDLLVHYDWLIRNSRIEKDTEILRHINGETRQHYKMFDHALNMPAKGRMHNRGMGH